MRLLPNFEAKFYDGVEDEDIFYSGSLIEYMPKHLISADIFCSDECPYVPTMMALNIATIGRDTTINTSSLSNITQAASTITTLSMSFGQAAKTGVMETETIATETAAATGNITAGKGSEVTVMCGPMRGFFEDLWPTLEDARCLHAFEYLYMSIQSRDVRDTGVMPFTGFDEKLISMFKKLPHLKRFVVEWVLTPGEQEPSTRKLKEGLRVLLKIGYKEDVEPEVFTVEHEECMETLFDRADRKARQTLGPAVYERFTQAHSLVRT